MMGENEKQQQGGTVNYDFYLIGKWTHSSPQAVPVKGRAEDSHRHQ